LVVKSGPVLTATITNAVNNGSSITYTATNSFAAGQTVTITGISPTTFNISGTIATAFSDQFTITVTATTTTYVSGGTATVLPLGNLTEWQNASSSVLSYIDPNGYVYAPRINVNNTGINNAPLAIKSNAVGNIVSVFQGLASQTADLTQWQSSTGAIQLRINSSGQIQSKDSSSSVVVKQNAVKNATITAASTSGGIITYTAVNTYVAGETVSIFNIISTGNPTGATGSGFNLASATILSATPSQFTIANALSDTYTSGGTVGTSTTADILQIQDSAGTVQVRVTPTGLTSPNQIQASSFFVPTAGGFGFLHNNGIVMTSDGANGTIRPYGGTGSTVRIRSNSLTTPSLVVLQSGAGHTGDLQQWWDSNNATLAKVDYLGNITAPNLQLDILPIDNLTYQFDGIENRFLLTYQGIKQSILNPFRLLITLNGIIQSVSLPEYVWGTPFSYDGLILDSDGYMSFSEVPPVGTNFVGRLEAGFATSTTTYSYPFKPMDILLGAY